MNYWWVNQGDTELDSNFGFMHVTW